MNKYNISILSNLYPKQGNWFMPERGRTFDVLQAHIAMCLFTDQFVPNKTVLDVACGSGHISASLKRNAERVIGGDISKSAIEYAVLHYEKDGLDFLLLDAQWLPFPDGTFDVIVSLETIEHLPEYEQFLSECKRVLKPIFQIDSYSGLT
ncbi:class I SAM-dependent methyltransferase [Dehalococcoidia bacterium]|nr:class I SAM-dependent methyltransferase [Dehalococcoidia bacterium]